MAKVAKIQLVKAAKELNEVLGLDPAIETKGDEAALQAKILEAADLIEPGDSISKSTLELIKKLRAANKSDADEEAAATNEDADGEDAGDEAENNESDNDDEAADESAENAEVQPENKNKKAAKKEKPEKPKKEKPAKPSKPKKALNRAQALARALWDTKGEFTVQEIITASRLIYETANGVKDKSDTGAKAEWDVVYRGLLAVGVLKPGKAEKSFVYVGPRPKGDEA